ncbi:hypothetical protein B0H14DRAFT_3448406 [Mycena olivaceomarginata]|nr:hypothetical protein B0H14DRAFT_3448406 [Mycena olivaceomarginata]
MTDVLQALFLAVFLVNTLIQQALYTLAEVYTLTFADIEGWSLGAQQQQQQQAPYQAASTPGSAPSSPSALSFTPYAHTHTHTHTAQLTPERGRAQQHQVYGAAHTPGRSYSSVRPDAPNARGARCAG